MKLKKVVKKIIAGVMVAAMIVTLIRGVGNVKEVYAGSSSDWNKINIGYGNDFIKSATIHFTKKDSLCSITKSKVTGISNKTYTGKSQTQPKLVVKLGSKTLKSGTDYTVTYKNNKAVGKASVVITGKNAYKGTITSTFIIAPRTTSISGLVANKKAFTAVIKKQTSQTTGYQIQYGMKSNFKGAKVKSVSNKTTKVSISKLTSGKKYYVRVRTYKNVKVNGKMTAIYSAWSKAKNVKVR